MAKAAFTTLGCKVNQYETQQILQDFESCGFEIVPFGERADVYVINSCSVTSDAERKSRYTIRRAHSLNPESKVVVTGCAAQMALNKGEVLEGADVVVPNPEKLETLRHLVEAFPAYGALTPRHSHQFNGLQGRTRATLKIQDGCNVHCSYCSIPSTRPGMVSRPAIEVLQEAQRMAELGYKEAILTGVLIGAYGPETGSGGPKFEELVRLLAAESGLSRLRISSIEMHQVTDPILELAEDGVVVPHFHIPLQSGDTGVLKDMNRRYGQQEYIDLCHRIYRRLPMASLTTDIMVGFPTETEERFQSSLKVCDDVRYLSAHIFTFSPRWGTKADAWGDPVPAMEKAERRLRLMEATHQTSAAHHQKFLGQTHRVLVEGKPDRQGLLNGLTDNYLRVKFPGPQSMCRTLQWVELQEFDGAGMLGEWVSQKSSRSPLRMSSR